MTQPENLIACITPPGTGAIATIALRGPKAWQGLSAIISPRPGSSAVLPANPEIDKFFFGRLEEPGNSSIAEEVIVIAKKLEPAPWLEVHCHGGKEVVRWLLEIFENQGFLPCSWQELELRTSVDKIHTVAHIALAEAVTLRTAAILLDQLRGSYAQSLKAIITSLAQNDRIAAENLLINQSQYSSVGQHLTVPWKVAVVGAPNAGKSSLVNALAGYQRSVVASSPGTTRDVVTTSLAVDGWPIELYDTAGLRFSTESLENEGISRALTAAAAADLRIWVLDASLPPVWPDLLGQPVHLVINKIDLEPKWDLNLAEGAVRVSVHTGVGLLDLYLELSRWLVPKPPPPGTVLPFTPFLCRGINLALAYCKEGKLQDAQNVLYSLMKLPHQTLSDSLAI